MCVNAPPQENTRTHPPNACTLGHVREQAQEHGVDDGHGEIVGHHQIGKRLQHDHDHNHANHCQLEVPTPSHRTRCENSGRNDPPMTCAHKPRRAAPNCYFAPHRPSPSDAVAGQRHALVVNEARAEQAEAIVRSEHEQRAPRQLWLLEYAVQHLRAHRRPHPCEPPGSAGATHHGDVFGTAWPRSRPSGSDAEVTR